MIPTLHRLRRIVFDPLAWYLSRRELRGFMEHTDPDQLVDATESYIGRGFYARIRAVQERSEILGLTEIVRRLAPRVVVEIGTYKGGTLFLWCRLCREARLIASIDLPGGRWGGGYGSRRERLYREFLYDRDTELVLMRADSHRPETLAALRGRLNGAPIDFLYIDGDHTYEGVKEDFEMYSPLVRPGGCVAFHDIVTRRPDVRVARFWEEIRGSFRHEELVDRPRSNKGIGILYL